MKALQESEKPQISVGLEFTFMGVDLGAFYSKKPGGFQIFVAPMSVDNNVGITLDEMIAQFNQLAGDGALDAEKVKEKIESEESPENLAGIEWNNIKFCLKILFLNISRETGKEDITEYALSFQILADGLIPKEITMFNVKSLSFNIWNTKRQNVLDKMPLMTPELF